MLVFACPRCSTRLKVGGDLDPDDRIECTNCGKTFRPPHEAVVHRGRNARQSGMSCSSFGCLILVAVSVGLLIGWELIKRDAMKDIAAADKLYAENKKAEAVALYEANYAHVPRERESEIVKRIVDHEATAGNKTTAREYVQKGFDRRMEIVYETQAARDIVVTMERERVHAEAKKKEADAARKADEAVKAKQRDEAQGARDQVRANKNLSRDQLRALLNGQNERQVLDALGKPNDTQDDEGIGKLWYYYNAGVDPVTGRKSSLVQIVFMGGVVTNVNFN